MTDQLATDRLDGKSALVTGGGGGFGKACEAFPWPRRRMLIGHSRPGITSARSC
jgi:hypothetical protein